MTLEPISPLFLDRAGGRGGGGGGVVTLTQRTRDDLDTNEDTMPNHNGDTTTVPDAYYKAFGNSDDRHLYADANFTQYGYWHNDAVGRHFHGYGTPTHTHHRDGGSNADVRRAPDPTGDRKRRLSTNNMPLTFVDTAMFVVLNTALAVLCVAGAVALIAWAWKEWGE